MYSPIDNDGSHFWIHTTLDAPNGRVVAVDLENPTRENWKTIIPESRNHLDSVSLIANTLIASYLADAKTVVELHAPQGGHLGRLALPAIGTAAGFGGKRTDTETFYLFTNFTTPGTIYRLDMKSRESVPYRKPELKFDPELYETEQVFYTSKDGTRVPMFLSYKKELQRNGVTTALTFCTSHPH